MSTESICSYKASGDRTKAGRAIAIGGHPVNYLVMADAAQTRIETPTEIGGEARPDTWPLGLKIVFRFVFCYLLLYSMPEPGRISILGSLPGGFLVASPYRQFWHVLVPWVAIHWFHVTGQAATYFPTGSGDTTLAYVENLLYLLIAAGAAILWSAIDRKRRDYRTVHSWFRIWVRYTLALTMFGYGFAKVFPLQFRPPGFQKLLEPWGDFSPMGALWSFMGASIAYIIFSGASEVLGGLLLLTRRTTTLGAMVCFAVLVNVAALNYCYDVPVKLYSTNLILMAVFLLAPDFARVFHFLVLNRATEPADLGAPRFSRRWMRIGATAFQVVFIGYILITHVVEGRAAYRASYINPERPPLFGLYEVESFSRNGKDAPPLLTDASRWRRVLFQFPKAMSVGLMNDTVQGYGAEYDTANKQVTLTKAKDRYPFSYAWSDPERLALQGTMGGEAIAVKLRKIDTVKKYRLLNRGFHWINEMPFNR